MSRYLRHILLIFFLLNAVISIAQKPSGQGRPNIPETKLKGVVVDQQTNAPLEYATVSVYSARDTSLVDGTVTDVNGVFNINVKGRAFIVDVSFIGYNSTKVISTNYKNEYNNIDFGKIAISLDAEAVDEVEVIAERSEMTLHLDKRVFNVGKDLANIGGDATDILNNIPSVEVDVEGNVSLRGSENVRILIDGKPSGLVGMGNAEALKLLQSDMIERVEIITNPSAKYDAEGDAGIINIILKKEKQKGVNGTFSANTGYPHSHGLGININYRKKSVNVFAGYSFRYRKFPGYGTLRNESFSGDTTLVFEQERDHERGGWSNTVRAGMDLSLNKGNSITISGSYRYSDNNNDVTIEYTDLDDAGNIFEFTSRKEDEIETRKTGDVDFNYIKQFKKEDHKLNLQAKFITSVDAENSSVLQKSQQSGIILQQRINNDENENNWLVQADYELPWGKKGSFETGIKATFRNIENNYLVEELDSTDWLALDNFNDELNYLENIYAAYLIVGSTIKKFSWQTGLRAEFSDISVRSKFNPNVNKEYLNFFPSTHLSYKFSDKNSLQLSYSYRIWRPHFRMLLPFSGLSDARNVWGGNSDLNPEYTHASELGYLRSWEGGSLLASIYYQYGTNIIRRITFVSDDGIANTYPINLADKHSVGIELSFNHTLTKWWDIRLSGNVFKMKVNGSFGGENLDAETFRTWFNVNSKWKLPKDMQIQASLRYISPYTYSQGKILARTVLNLSYAVDVLKGKGTLVISGKDIFNTRRWRSETEGSNFKRISEFQWRSRQIVLSFSYRLNQKSKKGGGRPGGDNDDFEEF